MSIAKTMLIYMAMKPRAATRSLWLILIQGEWQTRRKIGWLSFLLFFGRRAVEEDILKENKMSVQNYRLRVKRTEKCRLGTVNALRNVDCAKWVKSELCDEEEEEGRKEMLSCKQRRWKMVEETSFRIWRAYYGRRSACGGDA